MASTISVYYKYTNDIDILLGTYRNPSQPHNGIYEQSDGYIMYNDGYLVQTGESEMTVVNRYEGDININFRVPFINTNYMIEFSGIEMTSPFNIERGIDHYSERVGIGSYPTGDKIPITYTATGYWK